MTDRRLTELTELTTPADDDLLYVVDVSDTTESAAGTSRKVEASNLRGWPQTSAESSAGVTPTDVSYPPLNVRRYGAVGDGSTDDTAAFNAGLSVLALGEVLYVPSGTYKITSELTEPTNTYWGMVGDGPATEFDISGTTAGNALMAIKKRGASLRHLQITGDTSNAPNYTVHGLKLGDGTAVSNLTLEHVRIVNCSKGLVVNNCHDTKSYNAIEFYQNDIDVSFETTASSSQRFYNCSFLESEQCLDFATVSATNYTFSGCTFAARPYSAAREPVNINVAVYGMTFEGCRFEHLDTNSATDVWDCMYVSGDSGTLPVAGLRIVGNYFTGDVDNAIHLVSFVRDANIFGNFFLQEPTTSDIKIAAPSVIDTLEGGNQFLGTRTTTEIIYDLDTDYNISRLPAVQHYVTTLADDATPSVKDGTIFKTGGTTTITDFDDGVRGQTIQIRAGHSVTITDNANIVLSGGANFAMVSTDTLTLTMFDTGVWSEVSRSVN